jgi:hypothetical protein
VWSSEYFAFWATKSHHLTVLEHAGLARRERRGRQVIVHRTARGTDLLHLYEL